MSIKNQEFTQAIQTPKTPFFSSKLDGVLGLGHDSISVKKTIPPFYHMVYQNLIGKGLFSFYLSPLIGELTFGAIDHSRYQNELVWHDISRKGHWELALEAIHYNNDNVSMVTVNAGAILDTSSSMILTPLADKINQKLNAIYQNGRYVFPCTHQLDAELCFVFDSRYFCLGPQDYVVEIEKGHCLSAFVHSPLWYLGAPFLRKYFTVFDLDNERVGLAKAV